MNKTANSQETKKYDVVIIGASIGGTTAATLFARQGLRVALIERNPDIDAYKKIGTHFIRANGTPVLKRLGVDGALDEAGAVRNGDAAWTRYGWVKPIRKAGSYGYSVRRKVIDPLLRHQAVDTPGVDYFSGAILRELYREDGQATGVRITGVRATTRDKQSIKIQANLVVGADGRFSKTAKLASLPAETRPNDRFIYYAYFRDLKLKNDWTSQAWYLEPDVAYALQNDQGVTLLAVMKPKSELANFKKDPQENLLRFFENIPDGPNVRQAEQVSTVLGMVDIPNVSRQPSAPGLALVGDAALAPDPAWGTGIGWALESAAWLVDETSDALQDGDPRAVDQALVQYSRKHHQRLDGPSARIADFSRVRNFNVLERLMYSAAVIDPKMAHYIGPQSSRLADWRYAPPVRAMAKALWINISHRLQHLGWPHITFDGQRLGEARLGFIHPSGSSRR